MKKHSTLAVVFPALQTIKDYLTDKIVCDDQDGNWNRSWYEFKKKYEEEPYFHTDTDKRSIARHMI